MGNDDDLPTELNRMAWEYEGFTLQLWRVSQVVVSGFIQVIGDHKTEHRLEKSFKSQTAYLHRAWPRDLAMSEREAVAHRPRIEVSSRRLWSGRLPYVGMPDNMPLCVLRMTWLADQFSNDVSVRRLQNGMERMARTERWLEERSQLGWDQI